MVRDFISWGFLTRAMKWYRQNLTCTRVNQFPTVWLSPSSNSSVLSSLALPHRPQYRVEPMVLEISSMSALWLPSHFRSIVLGILTTYREMESVSINEKCLMRYIILSQILNEFRNDIRLANSFFSGSDVAQYWQKGPLYLLTPSRSKSSD